MTGGAETIFPGPLGCPLELWERADELQPLRASQDSITVRANIAAQLLLRAWALPLKDGAKAWVREIIRIHILVALIDAAGKKPTRKLSAATKACRARQRRLVLAIDDLIEVLEEDYAAPASQQITALLETSMQMMLLADLRTTLSALRMRRAVIKPKAKRGPKKHLTWGGLIKELSKAYVAAGGERGDARFVNGLDAMNSFLPTKCKARATQREAIAKRVQRLFAA